MSVIVACNRGHNSATTLVVDGEVKFYVEEERLTRRKYDGAPLAARRCSQRTGRVACLASRRRRICTTEPVASACEEVRGQA